LKKQLLCTSAIALGVAAAAPASAQDWNLDWGGFFSSHVAFSDISTNAASAVAPGIEFEGDGADVFVTGEIIFTPNVTLDNGMTFGVNIQFEALNGAGGAQGVDEAYLSISSDTMGRIDIGAENSAGYKSMVAAPSVHSMYINSPSTSTFLPYTGVDTTAGSFTAMPFRQAGLSAYTEVAGNNDVERITYYTPSFNGLTIGVSYASQGAVNAGPSYSIVTAGTPAAVLSDIFDIGVNYSQSFGTTDVSFGARWGTADSPSVAANASDPETWGVGFQVGFSGFTIGGSYTENDNDESLLAAPGIGDSEGWSFGVAYDAPGPWSFSLETYQSDTDVSTPGGALASTVDREAYALAASRDLGPGVDWDIYLIHEDRNDTGTALSDIDGTILGTAINLSF